MISTRHIARLGKLVSPSVTPLYRYGRMSHYVALIVAVLELLKIQ